MGVLVGVGVLVYLAVWHRWQIAWAGPGEYLLDVAGVCVAIAGHLLRVWALSNIGTASRTTKLSAGRLVTEGPYTLVRHPLYLGNWVIALGLFMVSRDALLLAIGPALVLVWYLKISREEERFLEEQFGDEYRAYAARVPRFFPLRGWTKAQFDLWRAMSLWFRTKEYQALIGTATFIILREIIEAAPHLGRL